ncbi:MAG: hypothetical protein ACKVQR_04260 [Aquabacterium sp.]
MRLTALRGSFAAPLLSALLVAWALAACGGGDDDPVPLQIDGAPQRIVMIANVVLQGTSFVPDGSTCPRSNEFVVIGALGPHTITYRSAATGVEGPVFDMVWVCNSGDGRVMSWVSNPISLIPGDNRITVTMTAPGRSSAAEILVTRR